MSHSVLEVRQGLPALPPTHPGSAGLWVVSVSEGCTSRQDPRGDRRVEVEFPEHRRDPRPGLVQLRYRATPRLCPSLPLTQTQTHFLRSPVVTVGSTERWGRWGWGSKDSARVGKERFRFDGVEGRKRQEGLTCVYSGKFDVEGTPEPEEVVTSSTSVPDTGLP